MVTMATLAQNVATRANRRIAAFNLVAFLLTLLSVPFIVLGWVARLAYRVVLVVVIWAYSGLEEGWTHAGPKAGSS